MSQKPTEDTLLYAQCEKDDDMIYVEPTIPADGSFYIGMKGLGIHLTPERLRRLGEEFIRLASKTNDAVEV